MRNRQRKNRGSKIWILNFTYNLYNFILLYKLPEVIAKKFIKFIVLSRDKSKRRFFWERLGFLPKIIKQSQKNRWIWIHANSIGEVNACYALIRMLKDKYPQNKILLTTTNFSADERAMQLNIAGAVTFFPYDIPLIIKKYLKIFNPLCVIIVECDIWPNFVKMCRKDGIPILVISGIFADGNGRSLGSRYLYNYKFNLSADVLNNINRFCMQTSQDAQRLTHLITDYKNISITGDLKFSSLNEKASTEEISYYKNIFNIKDRDSVFIAGNIHKEEFEMVLDAFRIVKQKNSDTIMILAPRFIRDISYIEPLLSKKELSFVKGTWLGKQKRFNEEIILLDTMGELVKIYALGKVAFVGGSLVYLGDMFGGHNILEPAALGVPVLFGSYMHNFQNLADLFCQRKAAVQVKDSENLANCVVKFLTNQEESRQMVANATNIFEENKNVLDKTFLFIDEKLKQSQSY
jgi:3-deoxy-D-manno-octulosonic-acid transferase